MNEWRRPLFRGNIGSSFAALVSAPEFSSFHDHELRSTSPVRVSKRISGIHPYNRRNDALTRVNADSDGHALGEQVCDLITEGKLFESLTERERV